jgi:hypothetical protein
MPGYIKAAVHKYKHPVPTIPEHAPHQWNRPVYGAKTQYVEEKQDILALSQKDVNRRHQLGGKLLCHARAVDPSPIMPVNVLASEKIKSTAPTAKK